MKKIVITTGKATICVLEYVNPNPTAQAILSNMPEGQWKEIGTLDKMTEEVWRVIVEEGAINGEDYFYYKNVENDLIILDGNTVTESGLSLLKANGVFFENPVEKYFVNKLTGEKETRIDWRQWEEKLFDPNRTHFFIKQD